ncbi:MAG TPA: aminotransferase class V-fold PLP-dependent enzyme [Acholeplasma sp.]|nr:aminotransferase class V-fold PLP-dependent enzyme [Acholeplasma sp.]
MKDDRQKLTPFFTKLKAYGLSDVVPFDVPGHKLGRLPNDFTDFTGVNTYLLDANAPRGLDTLSKPTGVIKEAEALTAEAFGADHAFFLTNGTTAGIIAMIMATCRANEKIILPRNVHKSVINALIFSGAVPIFVKPDIDNHLGIANGLSFTMMKKAIDDNPDAVAVLVINPTYFGVTSDLEAIVEYAHEKDMMVLADEAHGSQLYFSDLLPIGAITAGADISATSMHKTGVSLTQSSILLTKGNRVDLNKIQSTLNMIHSTSPSALLMASLDVARKQMYFEAKSHIARVLELKKEAVIKLNSIKGISVLEESYAQKRGFTDFDHTKLVIKVSELGINGFEVYRMLKDRFNIQLELAETYLVLGILTMATEKSDLDRLYDALKILSFESYEQNESLKKIKFNYSFPESFVRPRVAYHAPHKVIELKDAVNEVSAESIMIYPPGIPMLIPGEIISEQFLEDIEVYQENGSIIFSEVGKGYIKVIDKENWEKLEAYIDEL